MQYIADLHIHSPYSRATSKDSTPAGLAAWARVKGIHLVGTGDFTHPEWRQALEEALEPAEPGLFRLRQEAAAVPPFGIRCEPIPVRFVLTAEISSIYKKDGRVRKIHNVIFAPDMEAAERLCGRLAAIGNLESDGRPILGLDARNLLEIVLETNPEGFLVPAHIWTPWFSLFGAKSGFDTIEECFGDLAPHIFCLETGLSSDPAMNRLVSALDRFTLISNSDCHSPAKLGREANLFDTGFDFFAMRDALREPARGFTGTIEFYPEEGKYHYDGHRKCGVRLEPGESRRLGGRCPECGRPLTIGVHHRVLELADRTEPVFPDSTPGYHSLIPLAELIGEVVGRGPATKTVRSHYCRLVERFGSEFGVLLRAAPADLDHCLPLLGEAVHRMRQGKVYKQPGYDGVFGTIQVFAPGETDRLRGRQGLFAQPGPAEPEPAEPGPAEPEPAQPGPMTRDAARPSGEGTRPRPTGTSRETPGPNPEQRLAIEAADRYLLVTAGPGTGKTYTLLQRLVRLLASDAKAAPATVVITFTNKAAEEIRNRLRETDVPGAEHVFVGTFHRFCLDRLRQDKEVAVAGPEERKMLLARLHPASRKSERAAIENRLLGWFEDQAAGRVLPDAVPEDQEVRHYLDELGRRRMVDIDGVVPAFLARCRADSAFAARAVGSVGHLFVDEFQDLNRSQYELVLLMARQATVFAIGDPDQAIYGFRGADLGCFLDFASQRIHGQPVRRLALSRNYRCAPPILAVATALIANNPRHGTEPPQAARRDQAVVELHRAPSATAEAEGIVARIEGLTGGISHFSIASGRGTRFGRRQTGGELGFSDIAVLCRQRVQAEPVITALRRRGIPVQVVGGHPFWAAPAFAPFYLRLMMIAGIATPAEQARLYATLKGVGPATVRRIEDLLIEQPSMSAGEFPGQAVGEAVKRRIFNLLIILNHLRNQAAGKPVETTVRELGRHLEMHPARIRRLALLAAPYGTDLAGFASFLQRNYDGMEHDPNMEAVTVMTVHAAKGLEFAAVFVPGLEEGLFPALERPSCDVEEERRLFYVAITRAERCLFLSSAKQRTVHGKRRKQAPSRFLAELPAGVVEEVATGPRPGKGRQRRARQLTLF